MPSNHALPLQQHPHFGGALRHLGRDVETVEIAGALPVQTIRRYGLRFAPRGPIWCDASCDDTRTQNLRASRLGLMNTETPGPLPRAAGFLRVMTPAFVAELDLTQGVEARQASMKVKWRNSYRKGLNHHHKIKIERFHTDHHQWVLDADLVQQRLKGFKALPHDIIHAYSARHPKDVIVLTAIIKKINVAAMLFLRHPPVATYHIGWINTCGRATAAHQVLLMKACDHFADQGLTRLDLGSVDTQNAAGLARFKIGSGAAVRPLGGTWLRCPGL